MYRTIVHEFIHALGVYHMHQRSDRDKYVKINWENIKESDKFNFDKLNDAVFFDVPYDAKSMMHYQTIGHTSKNGKPTIESLVNRTEIHFKATNTIIRIVFLGGKCQEFWNWNSWPTQNQWSIVDQKIVRLW